MHAPPTCQPGPPTDACDVLRFRMNNGAASLTRAGLIQTPGEMGSIEILDDPNYPDPTYKLLYVADYNAGFRIFRYPN